MNLYSLVKSLLYSEDKRTSTIKKNIVGSIAVKGVSVVVSFLLVSLTIDYLQPELYGVWLILSSILSWISFLDLGFTQGLKNKLTEAIAKDDWKRAKALVSTTYFMMLLIFVPVCIFLEFVTPYIDWCTWLNVSITHESDIVAVMKILFVFVCLQFIINVVISVLAAFQRVAFSNLISAIGSVCSLITIIVVKHFFPPSLLVLSYALSMMPVISMFIGSLILYRSSLESVRPSFSCIKFEYIGDLFNLGYKFFIINIQVVVLYQATNILISNVSSPLDVTHYNLAYRYLNSAMMLFTLATAPLWPAYTDAFARGDYKWMKSMKLKMNKFYSISVIGCICLALSSDFFYKIWVGDNVNIPYTMTSMVTIYVIIYCWVNLNGTFIVGIGKIKLDTILVVVGLFIHIPLSLLLGKYMRAYGVVLSMIIINLIYATSFHIQVRKILNQTAKGIWFS